METIDQITKKFQAIFKNIWANWTIFGHQLSIATIGDQKFSITQSSDRMFGNQKLVTKFFEHCLKNLGNNWKFLGNNKKFSHWINDPLLIEWLNFYK